MKCYLKMHKLSFFSIMILTIWAIYIFIICSNETLINNDPMIMYYHMITDLNLYYIPILSPLFVIIPAIYQFHSKLHSGIIKEYLTRTKYQEYMKKEYVNSIKCSLILPLFVVLLVIFSCIITKSTSFGIGVDLYGYLFGSPEKQYADMMGMYIVIYLLNIFIYSIFYINIGLIFSKKYSNLLVSIILSYLAFIGIDIFLEVFLSKFLNLFINFDFRPIFNLFNIWTYHKVDNIYLTLITSISLVVASFIVLYITYRKKEEVIIASE